MQIILASTNSGKLKEIQALLEPMGHELILQSTLNIPDAEETGLSFIENAILKARHAAQYANLPAIADDSGLCVDFLRGAPGIYSARYAGPEASSHERNQKLLDALEGVPSQERGAQFYCVAAFVRYALDPTPLLGIGTWRGEILLRPQGEQGFGYDPVFHVTTHQCSSAELAIEEKNRISHRALAFKKLATKLFL